MSSVLPAEAGSFAVLVPVTVEGFLTCYHWTPVIAFVVGAKGLESIITTLGVYPPGTALLTCEGSVESSYGLWSDYDAFLAVMRQKYVPSNELIH